MCTDQRWGVWYVVCVSNCVSWLQNGEVTRWCKTLTETQNNYVKPQRWQRSQNEDTDAQNSVKEQTEITQTWTINQTWHANQNLFITVLTASKVFTWVCQSWTIVPTGPSSLCLRPLNPWFDNKFNQADNREILYLIMYLWRILSAQYHTCTFIRASAIIQNHSLFPGLTDMLHSTGLAGNWFMTGCPVCPGNLFVAGTTGYECVQRGGKAL